MLTGSAPKGRHGNHYHYYHCTGSCKCRFKAATVNAYFENELLRFQLAPVPATFFKSIVLDVFKSEHRDGLDERKVLAEQMDEQEKMLSNARKWFMMEEIDAEDFRAIKGGCNESLKMLKQSLQTCRTKPPV